MVALRVGDKKRSRNAEREVAAALESVFPRIAIKSFLMMRDEDKRKQLAELTNLVLGVRLFNKEIGKGGKDLEDVSTLIGTRCAKLYQEIQEYLAESKEKCNDYTDVIQAGRRSLLKKQSEDAPDEDTLQRWQKELTNEDNFYFMRKVSTGTSSLSKRNGCFVDIYYRELESLKTVVGSRNSVPKEVVYPKFCLLARNWMAIMEKMQQVAVIEGRVKRCNLFLHLLEVLHQP